MKNQAIAYKQLKKNGLSDEAIMGILPSFMASATPADITPVVYEDIFDFVSRIQFALGKARDLGMLQEHIANLMEVEDTDGTASTAFLMEVLAPLMLTLPEQVAAKEAELAPAVEEEIPEEEVIE